MKHAIFRAILTTVTLSACDRSTQTVPSPVASTAASSVAAAVGCEAREALDRLDSRTGVPLLPIMANHQRQSMRDHLLAVQEIVAAAASDDFTAIERSAKRIGYSDQMGQMCTHMGAATPGFTERALDFHRIADTIGSAAQKRDRVAVLRALGSTLEACTSCHASFRQRVVDQATWSHLAAAPLPR